MSFVHIAYVKLGKASTGDNEVKLANQRYVHHATSGLMRQPNIKNIVESFKRYR